MDEFLALKVRPMWQFFKKEHFSFWMVCGYIFCEYVRPQSIIPALDILPWTQLFIFFAAIGYVMDPKKKPTANYISVFMVIFYLSILISTFTAYDTDVALEHQSNFYTWLIIYFLLIFCVNSERRFFIFFLIIMVASFKLSAFGTKTWALRGFSFAGWGISGPPGFFQNSGEYAIQMCLLFAMSWYLYLAVKPHASKWMARLVLLFPITAAMSVLAASSRGAQLALVAQAYFIFLHGKVKFKAVISLIVVLGAGYYLLPEEQMRRFESAGNDKTSVQRLLYWEHGVDMLNDHPAFGVGFFNFTSYYDDHYSEDNLFGNAQLPHNIFVQMGADLGYFGLMNYVILILGAFHLSRKTRTMLVDVGLEEDWKFHISKGLSIGFIGFLVAGQFVTVGYYPFMWIQLSLIVSLFLIVRRNFAGALKKRGLR
ncbi:MAG: O-antigen ligase family protein [Pseudomonadales bacterium]